MNHKGKSTIGVVSAGFGLPRWTLLSVLMPILIVAALLTACAGEQPTPTPQTPAPLPPTPAAASPEDSAPEQRTAPPPNPTRRPTRAPIAITVTQPAPAQSQAPTLQREIDTSLILWGDLFGQLAADEQSCLRTELGDGLLAEASAQPISPEEPQWAPALSQCLDPDKAMAIPGAMLFSLMVNEVLLGPAGGDEITPEARECVRDLLADIDVGEVFATVLQDPGSPPEPNQEILELAAGIQNCAPASAGFMGQPESPHPAPNTDAILWQTRLFEVDFGAISLLLNAPTVLEGVVYVGADDNKIHALDAATGDELWSFETGDIVRSTVTVANGMVYAGSNDNHLYALDADVGDLIWKHDTGDAVQYPPLVADGRVYVPSLAEGDRRVHALDAAAGDQVWVASQYYPFDTGWESGFGGVSNGDLLLSVGYDGELHAFDAATGDTAWTTLGEGVRTDTPPVVIEDAVYVSAVNAAYALEVQSGEVLWEYGTGRYPARGFAPVIDNGVYYFAPDDHLYALDTATGEPRWEFVLDEMARTAPVVGDGMVFVSSESGVFYAIDQASGEARWTVGPIEDAGILESADVVDGILYLESSDGYLLAFDAMTGEKLWGFSKGFFSTIRSYTISDGVVYIGAPDGVVHALDASSAAVR